MKRFGHAGSGFEELILSLELRDGSGKPPVCSGFHGLPRGHGIHFHSSSRECIFHEFIRFVHQVKYLDHPSICACVWSILHCYLVISGQDTQTGWSWYTKHHAILKALKNHESPGPPDWCCPANPGLPAGMALDVRCAPRRSSG